MNAQNDPKMPGAVDFFVSFWKLIWNLWTRKVTNVNKEDDPGYGVHKLSAVFCQFWKVLFWLWPRAQMIWPKHQPWRIRCLGGSTFMGRFEGRTLAMRCAVWQWIYGIQHFWWHCLTQSDDKDIGLKDVPLRTCRFRLIFADQTSYFFLVVSVKKSSEI